MLRISKELSVSYSTVRRVAIQKGLIAKGKRKYNGIYDTNFLNEINSPEAARFLGIMGSDGNINKNMASLSLAVDDIKYLENIKNLICPDLKLKVYKNHPHKDVARINICHKTVRDQLRKNGIVERKSCIYDFPDIPKRLYSSFILGLYEGDGSISLSTTRNLVRFGLVGCHLIILKIKDFLEKELKISLCVSYHKNVKEFGSICSIGTKNNLDTLRVLDFLYSSEVDFFMERKLKKFQDALYLKDGFVERREIFKQKHSKTIKEANDLKSKGRSMSEIAKLINNDYAHVRYLLRYKRSSIEEDSIAYSGDSFILAEKLKEKYKNLFEKHLPERSHANEPTSF
jgi:hypothetical protein